jgi:lysophospholipase L1-like esterase
VEVITVSKASAARRLATAAAVGGGGLGLFGGSLYGLLNAQAKLARRKIGNVKDKPPDPNGVYGVHLDGAPIRLAVMGDSAAAGYGARVPEETFGAFLASGLAELAQRPVTLICVAAVGAQTSALAHQIPRALVEEPEVSVIIIGANDVTHRVRPADSLLALTDAIQTLRAAGNEVVVGTCPDLGTVRPIAPPLRQVARRWSRRLAAAQAIAIIEAGGRAVSLATILGPEFAAPGSEMFGPDQFHPSPTGYRACAAAMLPSVAAAIGIGADEEHYEPQRGERVLSLARAAAIAADSTGTEVSRAEPTASARSRRGRSALLRHRRREAIPPAGEVETELQSPSRGPDAAAVAAVVDTPDLSAR